MISRCFYILTWFSLFLSRKHCRMSEFSPVIGLGAEYLKGLVLPHTLQHTFPVELCDPTLIMREKIKTCSPVSCISAASHGYYSNLIQPRCLYFSFCLLSDFCDFLETPQTEQDYESGHFVHIKTTLRLNDEI